MSRRDIKALDRQLEALAEAFDLTLPPRLRIPPGARARTLAELAESAALRERLERRDIEAMDREAAVLGAQARAAANPGDASREVMEILRRVPLEGNPAGAPSSRAAGLWYDQQPESDYTCADCGRVGPKHYVQPQHPFYAGGRTDTALCGDCTNARNAEIRARNRAARAGERAGVAAHQRKALTALGSHYPDGRTVPREGDEVYTQVPGFGGMANVLRGVVARRHGALVVRATEASSLLGGRARLARAKVYDLSPGWTVRGEQHPNELAAERSERAAQERASARDREEADLAGRVAASKASGAAHLDDAGPEVVGRRVRSLDTGDVTTISEWHEEYGPLDGDGRTMGNKRMLAAWVVLP